MFRFTIRDVLWAVLVMSLVLAMYVQRAKLLERVESLEETLRIRDWYSKMEPPKNSGQTRLPVNKNGRQSVWIKETADGEVNKIGSEK